VIEAVLRRDRVLVGGGLALVAISAWAWTLAGALMPRSHGGGMHTMTQAMGSMVMTPAPWSAAHAALILMMWWVMMTAMMVPSAAPFILLVAAVHRRRHRHQPYAAVGLLTAGYLTVWGAFSVAATLIQRGLERTGLLSPETLSVGTIVAGSILLAAGLYQLTPVKQTCLSRCRSPITFLTAYWQPGLAGAFRMGLVHGAYCLGCCWFLMTLLFVGGVMNPFWIGALALYVVLEKLAPGGPWLSRASGMILSSAGVLALSHLL
jgi:predicted metal-binding membrane protein